MKRRNLLVAAGLLGGATLVTRKANAAGKQWEASYSGGPMGVKPKPPGLPGKDYTPCVVPNGETVPFKIVDGVKVFHLTAFEREHEMMPGLRVLCWGYNDTVNATLIEAVEGERVRIYVTNKIVAPTTVHWHGIYLPNGMDGVSGVTQPPIPPGKTFKYEWTLRQSGTFMYHSHHDAMTQEAMGLIGPFVIHPRKPPADYRVDRDFVLMSSEWDIPVGANKHPKGTVSSEATAAELKRDGITV